MSSVGPMGSNGWRHEETVGEIWRRDVASHPGFILITAVSLLQGPGGPALRRRDVRAAEEGRRKGGESVEGENEQALILCPGDLWS